jgi:hypothetical protein
VQVIPTGVESLRQLLIVWRLQARIGKLYAEVYKQVVIGQEARLPNRRSGALDTSLSPLDFCEVLTTTILRRPTNTTANRQQRDRVLSSTSK